jgi:hypothetical protein
VNDLLRSPRVVGTATAALLLLLALVAAGVFVFVRLTTTPLERAVEQLPASVLRASWTDWEAVAESADGSGIEAASDVKDVRAFLDRAFEQDLTVASSVASTFTGIAANLGVTPLDAEWELYGQSREGSVALLKLTDDVDLESLEETFAELGYQAPADGAGSSGVWVGTPELVAGLDDPLTPLQMNLAVVGSERLLMMSDGPRFLGSAVEVVTGDGESLASVSGLDELVSAAGEASVAVLWADDFVCEDLAMSQADPAAVGDANDLVAEAGGVRPLSGLVMARQVDGTVRVGMVYESGDQASADLQARADLASGPAPGQGGGFPDRFEVVDAVADGRVVTLTLDPVEGERVIGDLGQGPVLFATC